MLKYVSLSPQDNVHKRFPVFVADCLKAARVLKLFMKSRRNFFFVVLTLKGRGGSKLSNTIWLFKCHFTPPPLPKTHTHWIIKSKTFLKLPKQHIYNLIIVCPGFSETLNY